MNPERTTKSEVKTCLKKLFKNENIENLDFDVLGNSEKGDGYVGDIIFAEVRGTTKEETCKKFNVVLKCSKTSEALREKAPVKDAFLNEIYFYDVIFPSFKKFQNQRKSVEPFEKVPKCYGTLNTGNSEFLALENLKSKGYTLWDKRKPLTRRHIDMVVKEYGKFHAVSIAMQNQEPERFQMLVDGIDNLYSKFLKSSDIVGAYEQNFTVIQNLLKNDLDENILQKLHNFKLNLGQFFEQSSHSVEDLNVILHGDCWNNNFMHYQKNGEPSSFAMLDWQIIRYSSPIFDLSYFLFSCLSEEDIQDVDTIKKHYHQCLTDHLEALGSKKSLYPLSQFLEEWQKYAKFGLTIATLIHKISLSENCEIPDMAQTAEKGEDIANAFTQPIKNTSDYRKRIKYLVKYAAENNLI
ncbi:hypothetical protein Zmor_023706 [Zophobas morio]|uniref:CHK kinase-like domain-containing protein n=1 Tax=Zophobas morio TaxID=2755281 RepID=A0AA38HZ26_9CUCU|nr:hypothetical protein Zmor_023706 [Zophobas morio]